MFKLYHIKYALDLHARFYISKSEVSFSFVSTLLDALINLLLILVKICTY